MAELLLVEDRGRVRWLTINRPDKLNALNRAVLEALGEAFFAAVASGQVGAVVITGAGEKAFVAGADIAEFQGMSPQQARQLAQRGQELFAAIESSPKPVIAAVNGFALGGGMELAMACHLRVAAEHAKFGQPEVKLGLIPGYGGTQRLPRLVGPGRALELLLTGKMVDAATALSWGLVNRLVPHSELTTAAQALAEEILAVAPTAVSHCLEAVRRGLDASLGEGLALEASLFGLSAATEDFREGVAAFLQKRTPQFPGR
ncbi:MAG: enoyl-CoA hydratase-related protein [Thermoanaerobaculum sp.]|nr:enoyl-CoA hydratase-related protein [Thermoanaerobaculum sp.]MDW7967027.1 enoyl-CoA hydratase-related protein [Thermoanaerobaculum sp.]